MHFGHLSGRNQSRPTRGVVARVLSTVALGSVLFMACDTHGPTAPRPAVRIQIVPTSSTIAINGALQYVAEAYDAEGRSVTLAPVWSVVAGGGSISSNGLFVAGTTPGTYASTVQVVGGGFTDRATVTVIPGPMVELAVTPDPVTLQVGGTRTFIAAGKDVAGNAVPCEPIWSVVGGGGAIDAGGMFTAGAVIGAFANTVRATCGNTVGTATITVTTGALATITVTPDPVTLPSGGTRVFTAVGKDARGNVVAIAPTWSVAAGGGSINAVGVFVAGVVPGAYARTVTASSGGLTGTATVIVTTGVLATITVSPNPVTLPISGTQLFTAVGRDASGNVVPFVPIWTVMNGGGAISGTGLFTAGAVPGTYANTVQATSGGVSGTATVTVTTGTVSSVTVTPNPVTLPIAGTQLFAAIARDAGGNVVGLAPIWSVVAGGGSISAGGLFAAGTTPGTFVNTVTATISGVTGAATVTVTAGTLAAIIVTPNPVTVPVNGTQGFTAVGRDASGNAVSVTPVWSVVAGGGTIGGTGLFTAGTTLGVFANTVVASSNGVTGAATVTVSLGTLTAITVTPLSATMPIGGTQQFSAVGTDAGGNVVALTPVWTVVAGGGAISGSGAFTAGFVPGTFAHTVQASSGGVAGTASVTVTTGALAAITLTPDPATLSINGTQQFTAVGVDAGGNVVGITPIWSVVAGGGAINASGLFTAGTLPGTFVGTVTATSGAVTADASVTVTTGVLASIQVTPNPVTLPINGTQSFTAVGKDAAGNVVAVTPAWSVVAGGGTISSAGLFTAGTVPGTYANTVRATSGSVTGNATVTVTTGVLTTITVAPSAVSLPINGTQAFTAVGTDASGNVVAITPAWSVVAAGGTIGGTGVFTAGTVPGTYTNTVMASSGAVSGTATVTVTTGTLATITVTPNPATLSINGTRQFTAVGTDASGNVVSLAPVWSVVAGGGVINGTGLFTAGTLPGTFTNTVTATSGGVSGTATVTVTAGPLATVTVSPNPATLAIGGTQAFAAVGRDVGGNVVPIAASWSLVAGGGAISGAGLFTAGVVTGTFTNTVRASSGGVVGFATITVTTGALATITIAPASTTLSIGGTQQYTAEGRDAGGNVVAIAPAWSVTAGGGVINGSALFTAGTTPGVYANTVSATVGAIVGHATVTVTTGAVATITVTPNPVTLAIGGLQTFAAVARDVGGNVVAVSPTWSVVAGGGVVNGSGVFTAGLVPGTFTNTVQASSGGVTGAATVTVTAGALASITLTPSGTTLPINGTQAFVAVGRDVGGNVVALTPVWTLAAGGGSVSGAGLFTAGVVPGTFVNTVVASSGGISATATVTVTTGAVATITVSPDPATLAINAVQTFTAVGRDAGGNTVPITPSWNVVASGGSINAGGLFTASTVPGTFTHTVVASSGGVTGDATVVVTTGALASITVSPGSSTMSINGTQQATAVGRDAGGNVVAITPTWSVVAGGGAIGSGGMFTAGIAPGTYANTIQAASGVITGTASVTVTTGTLATITVTPNASTLAINGTRQYTAVGTDAGGNVVTITPAWSVVAGGGVIGGAGLFVAGTTPGTFANTVTASSGGITGTATVTVTAGTLAAITISPNPVTLSINGTQSFTAVGRDVGGNVVALTPVWAVVASGGSINAAGLFTAGTVPGTFTNTVQVSSGGVTGTATVTVTTGTLVTITVSPSTTSLPINGTQSYTAVGRDAGGNAVGITPSWAVVAGGGTISAAGVFTAGTAPGTFTNTVQATSASITGAASVTVTIGSATLITVTPNPRTLSIGETQQYTAVGTDAGGNTVPITPVWSVAAGGGAVDAAGLFTAGTLPGTYANTVTATNAGLSGAATLTVTAGPLATITVSPGAVVLPINGTQQYTAVGRDAGGNVVPITPSWSVVAGGGAINGTGLFSAGTAPGTFTNTVRVTSGSVSGFASVTVTAGVLATLTVTPSPATLAINGTQSFTAVGRDAGGNVVASAPTWSIAAGGGVVNGSGLFTAGTAPGTFANTVVATSGGVTGSATVIVTTGALATIVVTPSSITLPIGGTQQYTAVGLDAGGNAVALSPVWSIAAGGGTIAASGMFTAGTTPGTFTNTITVTSGGVTGATTVTVTTGAVASVLVSPNPATLAINGTQAFTAVGRDAGGNVVAITPVWSVVAGGGAISGAGVFTTGVVPGTFANTVVATAAGVSGSATVIVTTGALTSISVTPDPVTLAISGTQTFTAVGRDAGGNVVAIAPTWSIVAGGGAISAAGLFTAGTAPGTFTNTVRATSGAVSGSATVIVTTGALASITIAPSAVTLPISGTQQFTAVGRDAGGNVIAITPAWSVVAGGGAITGSGLFTAGTTPGTFTNTVTVTSGGVTSSASVTITTGALATLTVSPNPVTLVINTAQQFTAVGRDAGGNVLAIAPVWSIMAGGGSIDAAGLFAAGTVPGTFTNTVTATSGGVTGSATVIVTTGALATIVVSPSAVTLPINGAQSYTAVGRDAGGNVIAITPTWSVVAGGGVISAGGLFTAGTAPGAFVGTVRATSGAISGVASVTITTGALSSITVSPSTVTLPISGTQSFSAVGRDAGGNVVAVTPVWTLVAGGGAIDAAGLFTAGTVPGTFTNTVTATSGGVTGSASVTITTGALATLTVSPNPVTLAINGTQQFTVVGRDAGGNVVAVAPAWSVVAGGGTIAAGGLFTAGTAPGTYSGTVSASSGGVTGTATVTVTTGALATIVVTPSAVTLPINGTQSYSAVGRDAGGNVVALTPAWSVVAGGGGISGAGVFTAGTTPGTFANTVMATSGAIAGTATVTVTTGVLSVITVAPSTVTLPAAVAQQFTAVGTDAGGNVVAISPTWSVVAGGGAIDGAGLFTAGAVTGTFVNTVQASSGGITGHATVTVTAGVLASITVTPNPRTLSINSSQPFTAVGRDAGGNVVAITPTWSVVAGGGSIDAAGLFTAGTAPGTFTNTVNAASGGVTGVATVTVIPGALASIAVSPSAVTLPISGTQQYTAVGRDAGGNVVVLTPTWTVIASGGAINATGFFTAGTAPGTYTNTVQASSGGIVGTASVTVTIGALATITVTPGAVTLPTAGTQSYTAVGRDAGGNVVSITPVWSMVAGGGAISGAGLFTAGVVTGTFANTIVATSGSIAGSASVTVVTGALATITVTPNPVTLAINGTQQFTAAGADIGGNPVALSPTWSLSVGGGAINGSGLFTAGTVPGAFTNTVVATSGAITGTATVNVTTGPVATITVTPNPVTLAISGTQQFTAVGRDAGGNVVVIAPSWSVVAAGGAVSGAGLFTAGVVPGTFANTIQATSGGITGSATVVVTTGALASITVAPDPVTLAITGTQQFTAVGRDAGGNVLAIAPAWSVVASGGSITGGGLFTAGTAPGTFTNTVVATSGAITGTATVTVTTGALATIAVTPNPTTLAISGTRQFTAVGRDAGGNVVALAPSWSVASGGGVVGGTGLFTAGTTPGTFTNTVVATSGAITGSATVTVTTGPLAAVTVTPNPTTLAITGTQQFIAVGTDAGGNVLAITPTWTLVAGGGVLSGSGQFTAGTVPGTFTNTVQASSGGITGTATVVVTTGALASITVTPTPTTLAINALQQFTAVGRDAGGNVLAIVPSWTLVSGGGVLSGSGQFTAGTAPGTFTNTVQASSGGITGTATVIVTTGALASIAVTPNPTTLAINGSQQFAAVGHDAGGNVVTVTPTWTLLAGGGVLNASGQFTAGTAPGTFTNTVQASSGGITGTATVTVTTGPLATITVTPNPTTLVIGGTQQFTAVGTDAGGNVVSIAPSWTVVAGGGSIGGGGLFTAGTLPGTFPSTVQATSGTVTGFATVTVTAGPLAVITVTPNSSALSINGTQQFTAVGTDAGGNVVPLTPAWTVVAGGGAVSGGGIFTAGTTPGTFTNTVRAASGGISGSATVTVNVGPLAAITVTPNPVTLAINGTQQFTAVGTDAGGNVVALAPTWSVVAGGGAVSGTGVFTAGTTPGTFTNTVRASSGSFSGTATVTVTIGPLAAITVTPNPVTVAINGAQQFTAVGTDAGGNAVVIAPVWSVVAGGGAISGSGQFTASTVPGTFTNTVQATSGSVSGRATVTVVTGPLASVTVAPSSVTLPITGTQQYTAVGRDAGGNVLAVAPTWSVIASGGAISVSGLFTAGSAPGTFTNTVQASSGGITGTATVIVTTGALAAITVTPHPVTLAITGTQQFTAVGTDAGGNIVPLVPVWSIVAGGGAINATGVLTAGTTPGTYVNTVLATSGSITGTATLTVTTGPLATITLTPDPVTLTITGTQQFTAVDRDAGGNVVALAPTWNVVGASGLIGSGGLFTAGTVPGTFTNTVVATSGAISGTATVTVNVGPLATITVTPSTGTLPITGTQQYAAVGRDAGGNVVAFTPTWSVAAGGGAINGSGLFVAGIAPGTFTNTIVATSGAITGTASVTVVAGALATITVSPNPTTLAINGTQQFTAVGTDAGGNVVAITPTWSVVAGGGTIGITGLFTAGVVSGTFVNTVQVSSGSISGFATVVVLPASQTITFAAPATPATYGSTFAIAPTASSGLLVTVTPSGGCTLALGTVTMTSGTVACVLTATQAGDASYSAAPSVAHTVVAAVRSASVTPNAAGKAFGAADPALTGTLVGFLAGDNVIANYSRVAGEAAATYVISATLAPAPVLPNYAVTYNTALFTIGQVAQTITFAALSGKTYGDVPFMLSATGGGSGNPVTFAAGPAGVCTVSGTTVTLTGAGTCTVTASQTGNANYAAATDVPQAFNVAVAAQAVVTLTVPASATVGQTGLTAVASGGSGTGAYSYASSTAGVCTVGAASGSITALTAGTCSLTATRAADANYLISATSAVESFTITTVAQTITFAQPTTPAVYGSMFAVAPTASSGLAVTVTPSGGCSIAGGTVTMTSSTVACVLTASQAGNATYAAAPDVVRTVAASPAAQAIVTLSVPASGTVGQASLTASAGGGSGTGAYSYTSSTTGVCTVNAASGSITALTVGTCSLTATRAADANYLVSAASAPQSFTIGLGAAASFAALGGSGAASACIGSSTINGNVGMSPSAAISGFPAPCVIAAPGDGTLHLNDAAAIAAQANVTTVNSSFASMAPTANLSSLDLGGQNLAPGVYDFSSGAGLTGTLTLTGSATDVWVFRIGSTLITAGAANVTLVGANAGNVYWQVGSSATIGGTNSFKGNIIAAASITLGTGTHLIGRALSKVDVTMDTNVITLP